MIALIDMESRARSYLRAARILGRKAHAEHDTAAYLCGYAVEIALKARICRTLGWAGYPATKKEFEGFTSFQTHNLANLLRLSGVEARITTNPVIWSEWSILSKWNPEQRYNPIGTIAPADVVDIIEATKKIMGTLR